MDSDFRRGGGGGGSYDSPYYRQTNASSVGHGQQGGSSSLYPRIGQQQQYSQPPLVRPVPVPAPAPVSSSSSSSSSPAGLGIRVTMDPKYRITPPPQLLTVPDVPKSTFQFDFDFERKVLAELEKANPDFAALATLSAPSSRIGEPSVVEPSGDPLVNKYVASGLSREAVKLAVANYGDNPVKVQDFVNSYNSLREMGFAAKTVAEVLARYENDMDKALAHFLGNSS